MEENRNKGTKKRKTKRGRKGEGKKEINGGMKESRNEMVKKEDKFIEKREKMKR